MILSRITDWFKIAAGILLALIPVLAYVLGRKDAKEAEQAKAAKEVLRSEKGRSEFYKDMAEATHEAETKRPGDRDELVKRLRQHGL
jgi:hypothetical protein